MIRVVLDTNVIISAYLNERGLEAKVLRLALTGRLAINISEPTLAEYTGVLLRKKFRTPPERAEYFLRQLREASAFVQPHRRLSVSPDATDNRFLECAEAADADSLVTGNKRHFPKSWGKTNEPLAVFFNNGPKLVVHGGTSPGS